MKILYVASEAMPFVSSGGLADVMGSLPPAMKKYMGKDADIRVVIPMYKKIKDSKTDKFKLVFEGDVRLAWRNQYIGIWETELNGVTYYFIDNEYYFNRDMMYGNFDDGERFAFFGKAVVELMSAVGFFPDIMHANDWQSALAVIYLKRKYSHISEFSDIKVLFTIHNIEYQGKYDPAILGDVFELAEWDRGVVEYNKCINLLKGAVVCADKVSTVSERYSHEILTEYYSCGLHHILRDCKDKLSGITNGIDIGYYNPASDPDIVCNFDKNKMSGKKPNKEELIKICSFDCSVETPVIAMVSRLAAHKGFDLVKRVLGDLISNNDVCFALLGTGDSDLEDFFVQMQNMFPGKVSVHLEFNKKLSKLFYAGADMFLMPSKSEPCGLSQMIASRYGTVPIVRETGGLYDTIKAYNEYTGAGNGFSFANYNAHEMLSVIEYALLIYRDKTKWKNLVRNVMSVDFSWNNSAAKYADLYESML